MIRRRRKGLPPGSRTPSASIAAGAAANQLLNESHFYAAEAERQRAKITQAEARLAQFKQDNFDRLTDTVQANLKVNSLAAQDLEGVEQGVERELRAQEQDRTFILQQLQQALATGADPDAPRPDNGLGLRLPADHPRPSIAGNLAAHVGLDLEAQLAVQRATLAEMRQRYTEDHPDVKRVERIIQELQTRIAKGEKDDAGDHISRRSRRRSAGNAAVRRRDTNRRAPTAAGRPARKGTEAIDARS